MKKEFKFRAWLPKCSKMAYEIEKDGDLTGILADDGSNYIVMQYTGKKDKNQKDIYDGDICVCADTGGLYQVEDNPDITALVPVKSGYKMRSFSQYSGEDLEIVGNIYENKDLLK